MLEKKSFLQFVVLLIFAFPVFGADTQPHPFSEESLAKGLPEKIGSEWRATSPARKLSDLVAMPDAKVLAEYKVQSVTNRLYASGKDKLTVELFETKHASLAYGLWTLHRQSLSEGQKEFFSGRYLIRISAPSLAIADAVLAQLQTNLPPTTEVPLLPTYLPEESKLAASENYFVGPEAIAQVPAINDLKEVIDFTGGTHAALADYKNGSGKMSVLLVEFQSPQFATDGLLKMQQHFNSLPPEEQKKRLLRRVGNYAVEAVNVSDPKAAEALLGQIKYMARVHWEGKGLADIPIQFRPPDPTSIREAVQTGQFIVAAFYWIGILILGAILTGIFTGGAFFYWRRTQRRKLGLMDAFSDAGGMTRLNLDDYYLAGAETSKNLLGKGE